MKILFVVKSLPYSYRGGIQTHVWKLSKWLIKFGHEVSILTAGSLKKGELVLDMGGRKIIELPYLPGRKLPFVSTVAEEYSFNVAARKWLLKNQTDYDIIHLQGRSGNLFLKNKKEVKVPVVNTLHGLIELEQKFSVGKRLKTLDSQLHRRMATRIENFALQNADSLIAVSEEMKAELEERFQMTTAKTIKIYNGVDMALSAPKYSSQPNLLLFVGRLATIKGVFELVEAMRLIPEPIQLVMVGDGEARTELEKRIKKYGLENRISLTGALSSEKVGHWIERCQALILPSFHETQGIVLMEANANSKPVIAHAVGGVPEVVEHRKNGLLLSSNEPAIIATAVDYLFKHPKLAKLMGMQGKLLVQNKFSWEGIAKKTIQLYESLQLKHQDKGIASNSTSNTYPQFSVQ